MTVPPSRAGDSAALPSDRRERILEAAEFCLVRNGFDRTTMQEIARAAAMSAANLYRYFDSKEALVVGLVEREHIRGAALVEQFGHVGDERAALLGVIKAYFGGISRDAAILRLCIWSEATRNPAIADLVARREAETRLWFVGVLSRIARPDDGDADALYAKLSAMMKGLVVNKAILPGYDPGPMVAHLRAAVGDQV